MLVYGLVVALGAIYVGTGLVSLRAQPRNRIGVLMTLIGVGWLLDLITSTDNLLLLLPAKVWPAILGHLIVAFPTGRLRTPVRRLVVGAGYAETMVLAAARAYEEQPWSRAVSDAEVTMTVVVGLGMVALLVQRWASSTAAQRRTLTAMAGASVVAVVTFAGSQSASLALPFLVLWTALAGIPVAYLAGLLRRRIDRGAVADLVVRLSTEPHRESVRDALAATLHDPSLRVGYWLAARERYVDAAGKPMEPEPGTVLTQVNRGDNRVALLAHDPVLLDNTELVDAACAAVALALDNERLTAELRARLRQLTEATESERRRIEQDLHDGYSSGCCPWR